MKLRARLILLVVAALVPVLVFAGALVALVAQEQRRAVDVGLRGTTRALSAAVDARMASMIAGLRVLSSANPDEPLDLERMHERARRIVASGEGWHAITLVRPDGQQLLNTLRPYGSELPSLAERAYVQEVIRAGRPLVTGYLVGRPSGEPIVAVAVPVYRGGQVAYVLVGSMRTAVLGELLKAQEVPPDWTAAILDQDAVIVARSRAEETFVGRKATEGLARQVRQFDESIFQDVTQEGLRAYGAFRRSSLTGWSVVLGAPGALVEAPGRRNLLRVVIGGALLICLAAALALVVGRRIARPILGLVKAATALGQHQRPLPVKSGVAEVDAVAKALEEAAQERDRSEQTLRETHETFDALIASSPLGIAVLDQDGCVRVWNPMAEQIFEWRRDEVLNRPLREIASLQPLQQRLQAAFSDPFLAPQELAHTRRGGESRVLKMSTARLRSFAGEPRLVMALVEDITETRRAVDRLAEERNTVDRLHQIGAALTRELDLQRVIQRLTDEATSLVGASYGAYFRADVDMAEGPLGLFTVSGASYAAFAQFGRPRATSLFGPTLRGEAVIRLDDVTRDGRYGNNPPHHGLPAGHLPVRSYLALPVISRSGEVLGGLFFGHPEPGVFTARHEQLMSSVAAQAAVAIDNARLYTQAQRAVQLRDEFLSVASHELKTPLTSLELHVQLLRRKLLPLPPETRAGLDASAEKISLQLRRIAGLVEQLLDVSRLAAGRVELSVETLNLAALLRQVLQHFEAEAERAGSTLSLHVRGEALGEWDRSRLEQVFTNLVSNAIKYGAGKPIGIDLDGSEEAVTVSISDHGIGIQPEDQERIFERFERAVPGRNYSGLGLGLWITRRILEQLGGTIAVQSTTGKGATFTVHLPRRVDQIPPHSGSTQVG